MVSASISSGIGPSKRLCVGKRIKGRVGVLSEEIVYGLFK